jgi:hypothetical protein
MIVMTREEQFVLNSLLHQNPEYFTRKEIAFLVILSRYMRFAILSRTESIALQNLGDNLLDDFPSHDCGNPSLFDNIGTSSITDFESDRIGGPGGERPLGSGDGNDPLGVTDIKGNIASLFINGIR